MDAAFDAYMEWREESLSVWVSYARWTSAGDEDSALAFWTYRAALDREERASHAYGELVAAL
jgi:hypothetical protein